MATDVEHEPDGRSQPPSGEPERFDRRVDGSADATARLQRARSDQALLSWVGRRA